MHAKPSSWQPATATRPEPENPQARNESPKPKILARQPGSGHLNRRRASPTLRILKSN